MLPKPGSMPGPRALARRPSFPPLILPPPPKPVEQFFNIFIDFSPLVSQGTVSRLLSLCSARLVLASHSIRAVASIICASGSMAAEPAAKHRCLRLPADSHPQLTRVFTAGGCRLVIGRSRWARAVRHVCAAARRSLLLCCFHRGRIAPLLPLMALDTNCPQGFRGQQASQSPACREAPVVLAARRRSRHVNRIR